MLNKLNKKFLERIALASLTIIPLRGLLVLFINNSGYTEHIYNFSAVFLLLVCIIGFIIYPKNDLNNRIKKIIFYNFIFFILWLIPIILFSRETNFLMYAFYLGMTPFYIYIVSVLEESLIMKVLTLITIVISLSVFWDFFEINIFIDRYDIAFQRQVLLRPALFQAFGRTGLVYQPVGLFGDRPHDSAQLLSMLSVLWINLLFFNKLKNKTFNFILVFIALIALFLTQVASNIIAALLISLVSFINGSFIFKKNKTYYLVLIIFITLFFVIILNPITNELISIWTNRANADGAWDQMKDVPINNEIFGMIASLIIGHATSLNIFSGAMITEIAFVKILFELGLLHFLFLIALLLYPTLQLINQNIKKDVIKFSYTYATLTGVITLWHYGSLFSITNVVVFFALFSVSIKQNII